MLRLLWVGLSCLAAAAAPAGGRKSFVRVPVWTGAKDAAGAAPLDAKEFTVKLDGAPARVVAARGPRDDLMVLLVLDLTDDMSLADVAKQALDSAFADLPPKANIALLRAQDGLHVLVDPTTDRARLAEAIAAQPVSGNAGLLDTIEVAARIADAVLAKAAIRVAVLYVTDSDIRNYREDFTNPVINSSDQHDLSRYFPEGLVREKISKLEAQLSVCEAPLFIVHLNYRTDRLNDAYQAGLMQLAALTGGASTFCRSRAEIPEAVAAAFHTIASHYSLVLRFPEGAAKTVQVEVENEHHSLTYRNRFVLQEK